jgi:hypothetical protein
VFTIKLREEKSKNKNLLYNLKISFMSLSLEIKKRSNSYSEHISFGLEMKMIKISFFSIAVRKIQPVLFRG